MTVPRPIVIVNALGKCNSIPFETDYLLAYQPTRKNQKFSIGIMRGNKVRKLSYKSGDQWKINHELKDWEFFHAFDFTSSVDPATSNAIWNSGMSKIVNSCYDSFV